MKTYKDLMSVPEVALLDRLRQLEAELISRNLLPLGYTEEVEGDLRKSIEEDLIDLTRSGDGLLLCSCDNPNGLKEMEERRPTCSKCKKPY